MWNNVIASNNKQHQNIAENNYNWEQISDMKLPRTAEFLDWTSAVDDAVTVAKRDLLCAQYVGTVIDIWWHDGFSPEGTIRGLLW